MAIYFTITKMANLHANRTGEFDIKITYILLVQKFCSPDYKRTVSFNYMY